MNDELKPVDRENFFDVRRMLRILREQAGNASWFTIRHAEVALLLWDMQSKDGLEVQTLPQLLGLDQSTVNRILHTMGDKRRNSNGLEWIEVRTDEQDRRYRRVFITPLGQGVFQHLLAAGTDKDSGAELAKVTENHTLTANNIVMKAEVGKVEVKVGNVNAQVVRALEAKTLLAMETEGKVIRVMHDNKGEWWAYDIDDINYSKPLYKQKDTPKEDIAKLAEALINITVQFKSDNDDASNAQWDLEQQLKEAMATLNKDEYYRLRSRVMRGIAKAAEIREQQAQEELRKAAEERQRGVALMDQATQFPNISLEERGQIRAQGLDSLQNWAEHEQKSDEKLREKDMMTQMMAMMVKMEERAEAAEERQRALEDIVAKEVAKRNSAEGDGD